MEIGPNALALSNFHKTSHTSEFEDSEFKYDVIRTFLHSNSNLGKREIFWERFRDLDFVEITRTV